MTSSRTEPETFGLVAQGLNQLRYRVPSSLGNYTHRRYGNIAECLKGLLCGLDSSGSSLDTVTECSEHFLGSIKGWGICDQMSH
jgi:hypothetical protein